MNLSWILKFISIPVTFGKQIQSLRVTYEIAIMMKHLISIDCSYRIISTEPFIMMIRAYIAYGMYNDSS